MKKTRKYTRKRKKIRNEQVNEARWDLLNDKLLYLRGNATNERQTDARNKKVGMK